MGILSSEYIHLLYSTPMLGLSPAPPLGPKKGTYSCSRVKKQPPFPRIWATKSTPFSDKSRIFMRKIYPLFSCFYGWWFISRGECTLMPNDAMVSVGRNLASVGWGRIFRLALQNRETSRWSNRLRPVSLWLTTILHRYKLGLHPPLISGESTCQRKSISVEIANFCREKVPFFTKTRIALLPQKLPLFSWKVEHEYVPFLGPRGGAGGLSC